MAVRHSSRVFAWGLVGLLMAGDALADWQEPQPFRRDVIDGRQFAYNAESFLHRFTFEPAPGLMGSRPGRGDRIEGVAGSTRSDELYTRQEVKVTAPFDGPGFVDYRYRRFEDFDGRYTSNIVGVGSALPAGWSARVRGDVEGAKENADVHADLRWSSGDGDHLRASVVAVDAIFNSKQGQEEYTDYPYTYYLSADSDRGPLRLYGFMNYNAPTRLEGLADPFVYEYEQTRGGVGLEVQLAPQWRAGVEMEALYTGRDLDADASGDSDQQLRRRHRQITGELRHRFSDRVEFWGGLRYFRLQENDQRSGDDSRRIERRERMVYGGTTWRFHDRYAFAPGVFLNHVDNTERFPDDPDRSDSDDGLYAKLTLPLHITVNATTGGSITLNPTVRLHRAAFGGGNLQVNLPF